jgi:pilus assembly protein CpaB
VRGRRAGVWVVLAGAAGLLAVVFTLRAAAQPADGGWVVVARTDLPAATVIDAELSREGLTLARVPAGLVLPGLLHDTTEAIGRRTSAFVSTGEPLTQASLGGTPGLGPAPLAPGQRAVSVPLSAAGVALGPGARVDVVASTGEGLAGRTEVVVADAEVLATADGSAAGDPMAAGEALLRVTAPQALRITEALNFAREVRLLARPPDEADVP